MKIDCGFDPLGIIFLCKNRTEIRLDGLAVPRRMINSGFSLLIFFTIIWIRNCGLRSRLGFLRRRRRGVADSGHSS